MAAERFIKVDGGFERRAEPGDTLGGLASERGLSLPELLDKNPQFRANPNLLKVGERVLFPDVPGASSGGVSAGGELPGAGSVPTPDAPPPPTGDPYDDFNVIMGNMLKKAQGVGTADLLARRRALQRASLGRESQATDKDMRTLSPEQQRNVRQGRVSALSPDIDENAFQIEKANQALDNYFRVHGEMQKIGKEWADRAVAPQSVIDAAVKAIQASPDSLSTVIAGFNDKSKEKILSSLDYTKLNAPAGENTEIVDVSGTKILIDSATGETIRVIGGDTSAGASVVENQLATAKDALAKAKELAYASGRGRSWFEGTKQILGGSTDYTNLEAYANTLRTSVLSLATDPQVKKFFGPQMSNADVQLMTAAGTALNPELMGPDQFTAELTRLEELFNRLSTAKSTIEASSGGVTEAEAQELRNQGFTEEQIQALSFNSAGNASASNGNRPQRNNNPGNVKSGGLEAVDAMAIGTDDQGHLIFPDAETGLRALALDLRAKTTGNSRYVASADPSIAEIGRAYAEDRNWPNNVSAILGVTPDTKASQVDFSRLVQAVAQAEGFYA